jgi:hypothetical protein
VSRVTDDGGVRPLRQLVCCFIEKLGSQQLSRNIRRLGSSYSVQATAQSEVQPLPVSQCYCSVPHRSRQGAREFKKKLAGKAQKEATWQEFLKQHILVFRHTYGEVLDGLLDKMPSVLVEACVGVAR